jgi:hypothetical protein
VASFTCDCAIGREAGSSAEDDSGPYAKMLAWFAADAARRFALNVSSQQPLPQLKRDTFATHGRVGGTSNVATLARHGDATTDVADGLVTLRCGLVSTRCRIERCCATPFLFLEQAIGT